MVYFLILLAPYIIYSLYHYINNIKSTIYTAFSILCYSIKGLFLKNSVENNIGDTKYFEFVNKEIKNKKALILIHGLSGTGDSGYIKYIYEKLKNKYDIFAPQYGCDKHKYPTYFPIKEDSVYTSDVASLFRNLIKDYNQISFIGFSAGGGALLQILNSLKDEDIERINSVFFISPAFKMEEGFAHLEKIWAPVRFFMKYDYWKKFFKWIKNNEGLRAAIKFLYSCKTFDDIYKYFSKEKQYPTLSNDGVTETNKKFVLLHPDDDPIVCVNDTLSFLKSNTYSRINHLTGGHIGFSALNRCINFYNDDEDIKVEDLWDQSQLIKD